ncbi:MAG: hypothetical protein DRP82_02680 [Planctomycetota bacterium]|nr:MAG: hypothetical protein DRP82_02680 [Planctomycetota bacterium]
MRFFACAMVATAAFLCGCVSPQERVAEALTALEGEYARMTPERRADDAAVMSLAGRYAAELAAAGDAQLLLTRLKEAERRMRQLVGNDDMAGADVAGFVALCLVQGLAKMGKEGEKALVEALALEFVGPFAAGALAAKGTKNTLLTVLTQKQMSLTAKMNALVGLAATKDPDVAEYLVLLLKEAGSSISAAMAADLVVEKMTEKQRDRLLTAFLNGELPRSWTVRALLRSANRRPTTAIRLRIATLPPKVRVTPNTPLLYLTGEQKQVSRLPDFLKTQKNRLNAKNHLLIECGRDVDYRVFERVLTACEDAGIERIVVGCWRGDGLAATDVVRLRGDWSGAVKVLVRVDGEDVLLRVGGSRFQARWRRGGGVLLSDDFRRLMGKGGVAVLLAVRGDTPVCFLVDLINALRSEGVGDIGFAGHSAYER